jgi:hypothetical protein
MRGNQWSAMVESPDGGWREETDPFAARDLLDAWGKAAVIVEDLYDDGTRIVDVKPYLPEMTIGKDHE